MHELCLHPDCEAGPVRSVAAQLHKTEDGFVARFRVMGELTQIVVPPRTAPERTDKLWRSTCFEVFWQPTGSDTYREFNFAPSGQWAAYQFDAYRDGMRDAPVAVVEMKKLEHSASQLICEFSVRADLLTSARVALTAVVELQNGQKQYWSLAFPDGKPDFHAAACRTLAI